MYVWLRVRICLFCFNALLPLHWLIKWLFSQELTKYFLHNAKITWNQHVELLVVFLLADSCTQLQTKRYGSKTLSWRVCVIPSNRSGGSRNWRILVRVAAVSNERRNNSGLVRLRKLRTTPIARRWTEVRAYLKIIMGKIFPCVWERKWQKKLKKCRFLWETPC